MIVLRNKYFSEKREDNKKSKLSKSDKIALGTTAAGLGIGGFGQGYASKKGRDYINRDKNYYEPKFQNRDFVNGEIAKKWRLDKSRKLRDLRKNIKQEQKNIQIKEDWVRSSPDDKNYKESLEFSKHKLGEFRDLLGRKKGKIAANIGLGVAGATALGYGGYKLYKNRKNKKKDDNTKN